MFYKHTLASRGFPPLNSRPQKLTNHNVVRITALLDSVRGKELLRLAGLGIVKIRHGTTPKGVKTLEAVE